MADTATRLLRGRYELLETVGSGGEARVVKALDHQHERLVALKIRPVRSEEGREALLREARVLLGLPPHAALPLVREDFFEGEEYVVAMDWVEGIDLATLLRDRGTPGLGPSSVLAYLAEAAEALTFLHSQEPPIIHGDIKPGNLILTRGGHVKVVDFGMSSTLGMLGQRMGTVGFRAPELAAGHPPSRASDVYALAATAFALLTGAPPAGRLPSWDGMAPAQAEQLERALREGLASDPARRPPTPGEFVERLRAGWGSALPAGVITFCMSDIEGSTVLWERSPGAMAQALVRHDELIAETVEARGGRFLKSMGEGDSTVSVFDSARAAVEAVLAANRALAAEPWPAGVAIRARWGLHTGEAERRGSDYYGHTVNLAARVRGEADAGEVLLSSATAAVVAGDLPPGYRLIDLGKHTLKGIQSPERLLALAGPDVATPTTAAECPYRGLLPFEAADREFFFGREEVVRSVLERIAPGRLLALVGASGSGKSSVLRAGVVAAVQAGEVAGVERVEVLTPGQGREVELVADAATLWIVDQFEELYTICDEPGERERFIERLLAAGGPVVIAVRADFYGQLSGHAGLAAAVAENQILLGAMSEQELRRAVSEPARLAGLRLEPGLVDVILGDVAGEPGALPLLSHALRATWERRDGRTLTLEAYRATGGVGSAVARTADAVAGSLAAAERPLLRSVFLRMTELGEGVEDTRRRVSIGELVPEGTSQEQIRAMLGRLAEARLVTLGEDTAEVAHEVLIRSWPTLREWLEEDREGIRLHRRLGDAARLWASAGRQSTDLYRGTRLDAAVEWAKANPGLINETEREFLDASVAQATRERTLQVKVNRRLRRLLAGIGVLLIAAVVLAILALNSQRSAVHQRAVARAQALALASQQQLSSDPVRALLLARAAEQTANVPQARLALRLALDADHLVSVLPSQQSKPCNGSNFLLGLPGGTEAVQSTCDGRVVFLNLKTRRVLRSVSVGHWGHGFALSPDGRTLAIAVDQVVVLMDPVSARIRSRIALPIPVFTLDWDPSGRRLAFATPVGAVGWIDVPTHATHVVAQGLGWRGAQWVSSKEIVFGRFSKLAQVISDTSGGLFAYRIGARGMRPLLAARPGVRPYVGAEQVVRARHLLIATGGEDTGTSTNVQRAAVWVVDLRTGRVRSRRFNLSGEIFYWGAALNAGRRIAAGELDGHTLVLSGSDLHTILDLGGATQYVSGFAEAGSGRELAVDSADGAVRIYSLAVPERLRFVVPGQADVVAERGRLILDGPAYRIVHLSNRAVGSALPGYTQALAAPPPMDPTATSYVRLGPRNELEVVGIDGRTYCRCGIATPQSTGFFPLPSHRAGVLLSQVPYLSTQRLSIESYATHKLRRLPPTACGLSGVHPTLDSRYAAIDDECGHTTVYDLRTGAVRARFTVPSASINDATAVPRDRFAFGDDHGNTYVFDADGREQFALVDGSAAVQGIAASADGSVIATVSSDGILRIWNGRTGLLMRRITTGEDLDSVGMAPDGSAVYTDTATGLIESFDTCPLCGNGRALLRASDQLAVRPLSKAERQAFGAAT